jgi:hypothetical protein
MKPKRSLAQLLADAAKKAETSQPLKCPSCGELLPEGWRTDDVTGESDQNDDEDNEGDGAEPDDYDNRTVTRLNALTRSLTTATERAQR